MRELRNSALSGQAQPKIFYILPKRHEALTLEEKDLKRLYRQESEEKANEDKAKSVPKWIRQSSGVFKEEYLEQCHAKMLQDAMKPQKSSETCLSVDL